MLSLFFKPTVTSSFSSTKWESAKRLLRYFKCDQSRVTIHHSPFDFFTTGRSAHFALCTALSRLATGCLFTLHCVHSSFTCFHCHRFSEKVLEAGGGDVGIESSDRRFAEDASWRRPSPMFSFWDSDSGIIKVFNGWQTKPKSTPSMFHHKIVSRQNERVNQNVSFFI
jgi:hypothetical protein